MSLEKQEAFLNNVAAKLGRPRKTGVKPPAWESKPYLHLYEGKSQEDLIQDFIANISLLNTHVDRIERSQFSDTLENVISKFGVKSAIYWDDDQLNHLSLGQELTNKGIESTCWNDSLDQEELRRRAAVVDLGITWADLGLAETGTVLLHNGGGRGRAVSLLPPVFLCILSEKDIVPRLTQAVQSIHDKVPEGLPSCINFITGPSRTADIEGDLALGVHGPGKVHIIMLKD